MQGALPLDWGAGAVASGPPRFLPPLAAVGAQSTEESRKAAE
jgi:hypothetical protein